MAGTRPVWPVFFPVRNRRVEHTGLLAGTVYSGRTGRYGMESITLILSHSRCPYIFLDCQPSLYLLFSGFQTNVINTVPYRPVRPEYTVPAGNPVRLTSMFRTGRNTGRIGRTGQFRVIPAGTVCTGRYRKKFFFFFFLKFCNF